MLTSRKPDPAGPTAFCERCSAVCNDTCRVSALLTGSRDRALRFGPRI